MIEMIKTEIRQNNKQTKVNLGHQFFEIRKQSGLDINDIAKQVGLSVNVIIRIEKGHSNNNLAILSRLAYFYGKKLKITLI